MRENGDHTSLGVDPFLDVDPGLFLHLFHHHYEIGHFAIFSRMSYIDPRIFLPAAVQKFLFPFRIQFDLLFIIYRYI